MKKTLKSFALLSLIAAPSSVALAESAGASDASNFTFGLEASSNYRITNSTENKAENIDGSIARLSLGYDYKNVFGAVAVQAGSPVAGSSTAQANNEFQVREAYAGLRIIKTEGSVLDFTLGRERVAISDVVAPDGITQLSTNLGNPGVDYASSENGASFKFVHSNRFNRFHALLGTYNNLPFEVQSNTITNSTLIGQADSSFGATGQATQSRAYLLGLGWLFDHVGSNGAINLQAGLGFQNMAPLTLGSSTNPGGYTARNIWDFESSATYSYKKEDLKIGAWYQIVRLGTTQTGQSVAGNSVTYVSAPVGDSQIIHTQGIGVHGTSKLWGVSHIVCEGDAWTWGAAWQYVYNQPATTLGSTAATTSNGVAATQGVKLDQWNAAWGYQNAGYKLELNAVVSAANQKVYSDQNSNVDTQLASSIYLRGWLEI